MSLKCPAIQPQSIVIGGARQRSLQDRPADGVGGQHPQVAVARRTPPPRWSVSSPPRRGRRSATPSAVSHDWKRRKVSVGEVVSVVELGGRDPAVQSPVAARRRSSRSRARPSPGGPPRRSPSPGSTGPGSRRHGAYREQLEPLQAPFRAEEVDHERVGRPSQDVGGRVVLLEDAAVVQDGDAVTELDGLVDVVGDQDDGLAQPLVEVEELVLEPAPARWGRRRRTARPSASPADRRRAPGPPRPAGAARRTARTGSGLAVGGRGRPGRAARRRGASMRAWSHPSSLGTVAMFSAMVRCGNRPICWMT